MEHVCSRSCGRSFRMLLKSPRMMLGRWFGERVVKKRFQFSKEWILSVLGSKRLDTWVTSCSSSHTINLATGIFILNLVLSQRGSAKMVLSLRSRFWVGIIRLNSVMHLLM